MEQYIIKGGNPLVGEVEIGGAKNAALGILCNLHLCFYLRNKKLTHAVIWLLFLCKLENLLL